MLSIGRFVLSNCKTQVNKLEVHPFN